MYALIYKDRGSRSSRIISNLRMDIMRDDGGRLDFDSVISILYNTKNEMGWERMLYAPSVARTRSEAKPETHH